MQKNALLENIDNKGRAVVFTRYPFLEVFSRTSPPIIYTIYFPIIFCLVYWGIMRMHISITDTALFFFAGLFFWTFFEYIMHRFLFHIISDNPRTQKIMYAIHGIHHHYPRDTGRLFLPPIPSLTIAVILFFVYRLVLGHYIFAFFAGFILGYLVYGSMHYAIHAFNPPFKFLKPFWRNHHLHHYKSPERGFGVSSPLWDYVFGTTHKVHGDQ